MLFVTSMKERQAQYNPLTVLPVPVPKGYEHPDAPFPALPKHEFSMGLIAPKGSGKTTLIANMLYWYRGYFHDIFVFSPTVLSDEKWDWLKEQKLLSENIALKKWIKEETKKRQGIFKDKVVQDPPLSQEFMDVNTNEKEEFDGKIPEENFYHEYTEDDLEKILRRQKHMIDALKKHQKPKYLADRILLIFDDLVGSALFGMAQDNLFKGFNTRHRHYSASVIMVSQGYKEIPKTIRTNWTALIIFEIANDREVKVIYEENSMGYKEDAWLEMYHHAVSERFAFMYLNAFFEKAVRCWKNFDCVLTHHGEGEEEKSKVQETK